MTKRSLAALCCFLWGLASPVSSMETDDGGTPPLLVRVTDGAGRPLAGATVRAMPEPPLGTWKSQARIREETSGEGVARLSGLPADRTSWVLVERKGHAPELRSLLADATREVRIALQPGGLLVGQVVDEKGRPVSGADVELTGRPFFIWETDIKPLLEHQATRRARTGRAGRFRFHDLPEGRFDLTIRHPDFAALTADRPVEGRTNGRLGTFVLRRGETLRGTVTGAAGQPVAGARIWGRPESGFDSPDIPEPTVTTRPDGTFSIPHHPAGQRTVLWVCADGFLQESAEVHFPEEPVEIRLRPAGSVRGRVLGPDGSPLAGAEVTVVNASGIEGCAGLSMVTPCPGDQPATTDAEGRFHLTRVWPSWYKVTASAPGLTNAISGPLRVAGGEPLEVELWFEEGSTVTGRALGPDGRPVPGARIWIGSWQAAGQAVTQADGSFQVRGVASGASSLIAHADGYEPAERDLDVPAGEIRADLVLEPVGEPRLIEVRGRVLSPDGAPVEGARVSSSGQSAHSAWDGSFTLRIGDCPQIIQAEKRGFVNSAVQACPDDERVDDLEILLETGTWLSGYVSGLPAEEMRRVSIQLGDGSLGSATSVDAEGRFRLGPVSSGTWEIMASVGDRTAITVVTTEAGQVEAPVELEFPPVREVSGQVLDSDGEPLSGALVSFGSPGESTWNTRTRGDGSFSALVSEGYFTMTVREGAREHKQAFVTPGPVTGLEIRLEPGVTLGGRILGVQPWEMITIQLRGPSSVWGEVDLDGRWSAAGLPPGRWTLLAIRTTPDQEIRRTIEVPAGFAAPEIEIDLDFAAVPLPPDVETETGNVQP